MTTADLPVLPAELVNPVVEPFVPLVFEDETLAHQVKIRLVPGYHLISVSCNCLTAVVIESRRSWGEGEALACWRAFHEREEATG